MATTEPPTPPSLEQRLEGLESAIARLAEMAGSNLVGTPPAEGARWTSNDVPAEQRVAAWRDLAGWVDWLVATYELSDLWPLCWYRHDGLVEEVVALRRWHRVATHRSSAPADALLWHDAYWRFRSRALSEIRARCRGGHKGNSANVLDDDGSDDFLSRIGHRESGEFLKDGAAAP